MAQRRSRQYGSGRSEDRSHQDHGSGQSGRYGQPQRSGRGEHSSRGQGYFDELDYGSQSNQGQSGYYEESDRPRWSESGYGSQEQGMQSYRGPRNQDQERTGSRSMDRYGSGSDSLGYSSSDQGASRYGYGSSGQSGMGNMYGPGYTGTGSYGGSGAYYGSGYGYGRVGYGHQGYGSGRGSSSTSEGSDQSSYGQGSQSGYGSFGATSSRSSGEEGQQSGRGEFYGRAPKGYTRSDDRIREDLAERIMRDGTFDPGEVEIDVKNGEVTLEGSISSRNAKYRVEEIASEILGVSDVRNHLRVKREGQRESGFSQGSEDLSGSSSRDETTASTPGRYSSVGQSSFGATEASEKKNGGGRSSQNKETSHGA